MQASRTSRSICCSPRRRQTLADLDADLAAFVAMRPGARLGVCADARGWNALRAGRARGQAGDARRRPGRVDARTRRCVLRGGRTRALRGVELCPRRHRESRHNRRYWERRPVLGDRARRVVERAAGRRGAVRCATRQRARSRRLAGAHRGGPTAVRADPPGDLSTRAPRAPRLRSWRCAPHGDSTRRASQPNSARHRAPSIATQSTELVAAGLLLEETADGGDLRLSARGFLLSDSVFLRFV